MDPISGRRHTDRVSTTPRPPTLAALQRRLEERDAEIVVLKLLVEKLELQLLKSRRSRFGQSSEQLGDQPALAVTQPVLAPRRAQTAANRPTIDRSLPEHLPREPHIHRPVVTDAAHDAMGLPCGCTDCGGRLRQIGQDVSEQLEYVPARFKVIRHVRPRFACVACQTIFQAAAPSRPIVRGVAGPALLAPVMGVEVLRPHPSAPPGAHPRPRRGVLRSLNLWRLARAVPDPGRPAGGGARSLHARRGQGARRRHASARARPWSRQDQDGPALGLRSR